MSKIRLVYPVLLGASLTVACAKPPEAEIQAARTTLDSARAEGASEYAAGSLKAAEDAMAALDAELEAQRGKFALFRSYDQARKLATDAGAAAEKARGDARAGKEQARAEAERLIADARAAVEEAKGLLARAPSGKGTAADIAALRADVQTAETAVTEAQSAYEAGRYNEAKAKANSALTGAQEVKTAVEAAREKLRRRRA